MDDLGVIRDDFIKKYPEILNRFSSTGTDYNPIMFYLIGKNKKYKTEEEREGMLDLGRKIWKGDTFMNREAFVQAFMRDSGWVGKFKEVDQDEPPARLQVLY